MLKDVQPINNPESIGNRIMAIIMYYKLNRNSFAMKIGLANNSLIVRITNKPQMGTSLDLILKILNAFPEINPTWFVTGEGEMLRDEKTLNLKHNKIKYYKDNQSEPVDCFRITGFDDCDYAFNLVGTGMEPKYRSGDILICKSMDKESHDIIFGEAYLMLISDQKRFLRYIKGTIEGKYKLGAEDPRYEDSTINISDIQSLYLIKGLVRKEVL